MAPPVTPPTSSEPWRVSNMSCDSLNDSLVTAYLEDLKHERGLAEAGVGHQGGGGRGGGGALHHHGVHHRPLHLGKLHP